MLQENQRPKKAIAPKSWKTIPVFYIQDSKQERTVIRRTAVINMDAFICATPANYAYGYGKEHVLSDYPHKVVEYPYEIPKNAYVTLHFRNGSFFDMLSEDFKKTFGMEPPRNLV